MTRMKEVTTATVVERPTPSAPPSVRKPSKQLTMLMIMAKMTVLSSPEAKSLKAIGIVDIFQ